MADVTANIAKGRFVQFYDNVESNNPANSAFIVVPFARGATTDDQLRDADTLAAAIALGTERSANGWVRKTLTDLETTANSPDDTNNWYQVGAAMANMTWTPTLGTDTVTDLLLGYDSDTTAGTDANIVFCGSWAFSITPDGSLITAIFSANGLWRAT